MICVACLKKRVFFLRYAPSHHLPENIYEIMCCSDCGHCQAVGKVDTATLNKIYSDAFFATSAQSDGKFSSIHLNAQSRAKKLFDLYHPETVLDIGAGVGVFVAAMSVLTFTQGLEFSHQAVDIACAHDRKVFRADFLHSSLNDIVDFDLRRSFDLITLWDVLACFEDQSAVMSKLYDLCSPSGTVVLTVPLCDSATARFLGKFWPFWIPPVNQHFYTELSLAALAFHSKFRIIKILKPSKYVSFDFIVLKLLRTLGFSPSQRVINILPRFSFPINMFDIAEVHMEKLS
jgi:ubiquinone/menaquinone biosynthesis C-methylase UbiE